MPPKNNNKKKPAQQQKPSSQQGAKKKENLDDILAQFAAQDKAKEEKLASASANGTTTSTPKPVGPYFLKRTFEQPPTAQTSPEPTVPIDLLYKKGTYPTGQICEYEQSFNRYRTTSAEKKELEKKFDDEIQDARKAAEVHKKARQWMQTWVKPGMKMIDIAERLEDKVRELLQSDGLQGGIAFPTGCSLNHCAAHYTPNPGDTLVLGENDVVKFDLGVHVKGRIIDSAFTMCWNPQFNPLLTAVKEATYAGIKEAGIDVRLNEIGGVIQEVMESHEVEIGGKTHKVKVVKNLSGHSIERYKIHGAKVVPSYDDGETYKMEENEFYAIETFGSTGRGLIDDDTPCSHYMRNWDQPVVNLKGNMPKNLLNTITKNFGTLAFCHRYLDRLGEKMYMLHLRTLINAGLINPYPPLSDIQGSYVAQFEHTLALRPTCKEILSKGEDY